MKDKILGLVLSSVDYGENSQIIRTITKDKGYLGFIVRRGNNNNKKGNILPLSQYYFYCDYKDHKQLFNLYNRDLINSYYESDLEKIAYKQVLVEIVDRVKVDNSSKIYNDLIFVLQNFDDNNKYLLGSFFIAQLLNEAGLKPYLKTCVDCKVDKVIGFSLVRGGFVCRNHASYRDILNLDSLRKIRHIFLVDNTNVLHLNEKYQLNDFDLLINFLKRYTDIEFKAYAFYLSLFPSN